MWNYVCVCACTYVHVCGGHLEKKWKYEITEVEKMKIVFWSEMTRNANNNEFRTSKRAAGLPRVPYTSTPYVTTHVIIPSYVHISMLYVISSRGPPYVIHVNAMCNNKNFTCQNFVIPNIFIKLCMWNGVCVYVCVRRWLFWKQIES